MSTEQSNILRRQEQITKWFESETDRAPKSIRSAEKIIFSNEVQFLSACNSKDWHEIERLLKEGIDINCTQDDGLTSLHQACIQDDEHLVTYLIDHGANIDAQDKEGWTPLFAAISCNYLPITKYLISRGARLDMTSFDGELPLDQTNNEALISIIKEEMKKKDFDPYEIRNRERNTILKEIEVMERTNDFSKFTLSDNGGSLLHVAASKDYTDVLERLLDIISPEQLNHTDNDGWNALHVAAHWGNKKACILLVDADIDFDQVTRNNQTVLEVSDDNAKPYIREEIRKARFRRQDRVTIKRPATSPNTDYQPSGTKIICQDQNVLPVDNISLSSNCDKPVVTSNDSVSDTQSVDINTPGPNTTENTEATNSITVDLNINTIDVKHDSETDPAKSTVTNNITILELVPAQPLNDCNEHVKIEDSQPSQPIDVDSVKCVTSVLPPVKTIESESQRKDKARHNRSTRRSTQGVTAQEIDEAKKLMPADKHESSSIADTTNINDHNKVVSISNHIDDTEKTQDKTDPRIVIPSSPTRDLSLNGDTSKALSTDPSVPNSESLDQAEIKKKAGNHLVNKRKTRERMPTGIVDIKDIKAAHSELVLDTQLTNLSALITSTEPEIDYKALYENELKEKEKLQRNLARIRRDLEQSEDKIKNLQNNHVSARSQIQSPIIMPSECEVETIEKLRDENKKMKEANSALIRVISRLSHPPVKTSITTFS